MNKGKILIVDDSQEALTITSRVLKKAGYEVFTVSTGLECLKVIKTLNPDVLLLDILLPDISGHEVCRVIKSDPLTNHILVVYLTSINRSSEIKAEGFRAGADGYIVRPISNNELEAIVESYMRLSNKWKELNAS